MKTDLEITITGALDRLEGEQAVIKLDNGQELIWLKKDLPADCTTEGSVIKLTLRSDQTEKKIREQQAKDLLNELLKND
ncbi:MAG: DUF3006 domain-containing protein [Candidatus Buchananbacteria bacterium]